MAKLEWIPDGKELQECGPLPNYDHVRFGTSDQPGQSDILASLDPVEQAKFVAVQGDMEKALKASRLFIQRTGRTNLQLQEHASVLFREYEALRDRYLKHESLAHLHKSVSRLNLDITPPGSRAYPEDPLGAPIPAMNFYSRKIIRPGDDWSAECMAAAGMPPVYAYDATLKQLQQSREHLAQCHPWYRTAKKVRGSTTIREARRLLTHQPKDGALILVDRAGQPVGLVCNDDLPDPEDNPERDEEYVTNVAVKGPKMITAEEGIEPIPAIDLMDAKDINTLPIISKDGKTVRIMTRTTAALNILLKPFLHHKNKPESGFGSIVAVGVSAKSDPRMKTEELKKMGYNKFFYDTAHFLQQSNFNLLSEMEQLLHLQQAEELLLKDSGIVERTIGDMRNLYDDIVTFAGTVISGHGTLRILKHAHYVKAGIGGGRQCNTTGVTNVGLPAFSAHYINGLAAASTGDGMIIADGHMGNDARICTAMSLQGVAYVQIGSRFVSLRETPDDFLYDHRGKPYKNAEGDASVKRSRERILIRGVQDQRDRLDLIVNPHGEGSDASQVYVEKYCETFGLMALRIKRSLQSWLSYVDAKTIQQGKDRSKLHLVMS